MLLNVPTSQTSATSTSFGGSRQNPCASDHWSGMSSRMANPTPNTGYEPNFYTYMNEEHTPVNLPDSFQCRDDATIISAAEDPEVPHSGASSSSKQTAASRVPTMLRSTGASLWRQRNELVDSRASIQATGANVDRESVVSYESVEGLATLFATSLWNDDVQMGSCSSICE